MLLVFCAGFMESGTKIKVPGIPEPVTKPEPETAGIPGQIAPILPENYPHLTKKHHKKTKSYPHLFKKSGIT